MKRNPLRLFELIQLPGFVMVLDIQTTVSVIVNEIQMVAGALLTSYALDVHRKSRVLLFEFQQVSLID